MTLFSINTMIKFMKMPKLQPSVIKTQRFPFYSKLWPLFFRKRQ